MPVDRTLVARAIEILAEAGFNPKSSWGHIETCLWNAPDFESLSDFEMEDLIRALQTATPTTRGQATQGAPHALGPMRDQGYFGNISAPFRFVTLPNEVVDAEEVKLNTPITGGLSARVEVLWEAESPLLIGEETNGVIRPMTLSGETDWVIPGATFRGLIRSAVEIVAYGRLGAANLHHRYGLRDFDHAGFAGAAVGKVDDIRAGWLTYEPVGKSWKLASIEKDWAHVSIENLLLATLTDSTQTFTLGVGSRRDWIKLKLDEKYAKARMKQGNLFNFARIQNFSAPVTDTYDRRISNLGGSRKGTLVFSDKLPGDDGNKAHEYVFFDPLMSPAEVTLTTKTMADFERFYSKPSKNKIKPVADGTWGLMQKTLKNGGKIPVFYVGQPNTDNFTMGLTRLFKVPHERSVGEVLSKSQPKHIAGVDGDHYPADFVENLFGYVVEPDEVGKAPGDRVSPQAVARKGRVAFSFGYLNPGSKAKLSDEIEAVLSTPRASFAPFYLKSRREKDYSADILPALAGRKRYLPRVLPGTSVADAFQALKDRTTAQLASISAAQRDRPVSAEIISRLRFLMPEGVQLLHFRSEIHLQNVTAAELGAVLFGLTHGGDPEKPYRHMIGHAKPFGAGQMKVAETRLGVERNDALPGEREDNSDYIPFIKAFITHMKAKGVENFPDVPAVREYLGTCDPENGRRLEPNLDYLPLKAFKKIRDEVKPLNNRRAPRAFAEDLDGRLLPAPKRAAFWKPE